MKKNTVDIITMGCSKNLVDSERLIRQLEANGYTVTHDAENPQGEIAVINTCGFIGDAKEESINTILEFCEAKKARKLRKLYVMGCLSERYLAELQVEIPQVDKFYGKFNWNELLTDLGKAYNDYHELMEIVVADKSEKVYKQIQEKYIPIPKIKITDLYFNWHSAFQ